MKKLGEYTLTSSHALRNSRAFAGHLVSDLRGSVHRGALTLLELPDLNATPALGGANDRSVHQLPAVRRSVWLCAGRVRPMSQTPRVRDTLNVKHVASSAPLRASDRTRRFICKTQRPRLAPNLSRLIPASLVVAPTGRDRTCRIQVRDFITR